MVGAKHWISSSVIPLLPGNLLGREGIEDLISVPPFPSSHCTSAVTCDCVSPKVTELAWQRSPPAGLIIELRVIFVSTCLGCQRGLVTDSRAL